MSRALLRSRSSTGCGTLKPFDISHKCGSPRVMANSAEGGWKVFIKDWKRFTPIYFYTAWAASLATAALYSETRPVTGILGLLMCGFVSWAFVEYAVHRFALHHPPCRATRRRFISASHQSHHNYPQAIDQLFARLRMSVPLALCYCLLAWAMLGSWQAMAYLFVGLVIGYFSYEWLHYQAHHGRSRLRPLKYLRKYHLLHHHQTPDLRFGVTSPAVDYLFGTFRPVGRGIARAKERVYRSL